ncbi:MAG: Cof-type HAD-IIB family hydrolase [Lachnospiraceae bacterium]|nr:Cof-type HAD-IIB family hydrolase [Lachnospiraceae bacterium]
MTKTDMNKRLLFSSDMDRTLLNNESKVSSKMLSALFNFIEKGNCFVLNSGRPLKSVYDTAVNLEIPLKNTYICAYNGACIMDCETKEIVFGCPVSFEDTKEIIAMGKKHDVHIQGYYNEEIICRQKNECTEVYTQRIKMPLVEREDFDTFFKDGAFKLLAIDLFDKEKLECLKNDINATLPKVHAFFSDNKYLEIISRNADKGVALKKLSEILNIDIKDTYAAGDDENDIPMIKAAGLGIAMKNAKDAVKDAADMITEKTNDEDGLYDIIMSL